MTRAELLAEFRDRVNDNRKPPAWSDRRAYQFLSLGQDQFCKDTGFFRDATSYSITTEVGVASYPYSARIIEILDLRYLGVPLQRFTGDPEATTEGPPQAYRTDFETGSLTIHPTPDAVYTLPLRVWRKSAIAFSASGNPEIPEEFHLALVEYAAHLAYGDHDRETQDPVKAADHLANFQRYTREGKAAFRRLCTGRAAFTSNPLYLV